MSLPADEYRDSLDKMDEWKWREALKTAGKQWERVESVRTLLEKTSSNFTLHLPGKIKNIAGFEQVDARTIRFQFRPAACLDILKASCASLEEFKNTAYARADSAFRLKTLYGMVGLDETAYEVEVIPDEEPQFNFEKETARLRSDAFPK